MVIILTRKFLIAVSALMFRRTPAFQLAMTFLVLFVSYAYHVRAQPYMSMSQMREVVLEHEEKVRMEEKKFKLEKKTNGLAKPGLHMRARAMYGRKVEDVSRQRQALRQGMLDASNHRSKQAMTFVTDYNTVESVLLFCGSVVALGGISLQSSVFSSGVDFYNSQKVCFSGVVVLACPALTRFFPCCYVFVVVQDAIGGVLMAIIVGSLIYYFTILIIEMTTACKARKQGGKRKKKSAAEREKAIVSVLAVGAAPRIKCLMW